MAETETSDSWVLFGREKDGRKGKKRERQWKNNENLEVGFQVSTTTKMEERERRSGLSVKYLLVLQLRKRHNFFED